MRNYVKSMILKCGSMMAALAMMVVASNVNTACMFHAYQPELPEGADKLSKYHE